MLKHFLVALPLMTAVAADAWAVTIETVPVGNVGNANDPLTGNLYGGVNYAYRIGTTEVTNAQYAEFLNAKAASDPLQLYHSDMGLDDRGGIVRTGVSGAYTYSVRMLMVNKPVNFVDWSTSLRFANWLHNGQGSGDTETGAYTLGPLNASGRPLDPLAITRNSGATWFLPSENEWYKAAYHQPAASGGDSDDYWLYPTSSNSAPTLARATDIGDIANPGNDVVNSNNNADWNGQDGNVTTVGSAGPLSSSYYGTFDQGGNVWEWTEAIVPDPSGRPKVVFRGGLWQGNIPLMRSTTPSSTHFDSFLGLAYTGIRVATVPEPSSFVLAALGLIGLVVWRRNRSWR